MYFAMKFFIYLNVQSRQCLVNKGSHTKVAYKSAFDIIKESKDENEGKYEGINLFMWPFRPRFALVMDKLMIGLIYED